MIVKDEEAVISRALASAIPYINQWLIVDTGSTDNTKFIINTVMSGISGEIIDRPWVNFGHNRTEALELCKGRMDWAIMLDADDNLAGTVPPPSIWMNVNMDGFIMQIHHGSIVHQRVHIFRVASNWIYEGVVHEYPRCLRQEKPKLGILPPETFMETRCEGYDHVIQKSISKMQPFLNLNYRNDRMMGAPCSIWLRVTAMQEDPWRLPSTTRCM